MRKHFGMYLTKRFYPDNDFENDTGIIGRKEIITADGPYGGYIKDIFMYDDRWGKYLLKPTNIYSKEGALCWDYITEAEIVQLVNDEKSLLKGDQCLIYYEQFIKEDMKGQIDFEFCGYDLMDDMFEISAIIGCGNLNEKFVYKLNQYGLLDNLQDAIDAQKQLYVDFPDEYHAHCDIYGLWRDIKNMVK